MQRHAKVDDERRRHRAMRAELRGARVRDSAGSGRAGGAAGRVVRRCSRSREASLSTSPPPCCSFDGRNLNRAMHECAAVSHSQYACSPPLPRLRPHAAPAHSRGPVVRAACSQVRCIRTQAPFPPGRAGEAPFFPDVANDAFPGRPGAACWPWPAMADREMAAGPPVYGTRMLSTGTPAKVDRAGNGPLGGNSSEK